MHFKSDWEKPIDFQKWSWKYSGELWKLIGKNQLIKTCISKVIGKNQLILKSDIENILGDFESWLGKTNWLKHAFQKWLGKTNWF